MRDDGTLLKNIKAALPDLEKLKGKCDQEFGGEDLIYRFYHMSFKVFRLQRYTLDIVEALQALRPDPAEVLEKYFTDIVNEGTGHTFDQRTDNLRWSDRPRRIVEAYFHAKFFLDMSVKYGARLEVDPSLLPSGWAAVLSLYRCR